MRLAALRDLDILDTPPEERFDRITRRAAALFDVPIALVSLVDEDRQWIKSSYGLSEIRSTSREVSFCAHVVAQRAPMIVPDTLLDDRFAENPMVTGASAHPLLCRISADHARGRLRRLAVPHRQPPAPARQGRSASPQGSRGEGRGGALRARGDSPRKRAARSPRGMATSKPSG